MCEYPLYIKVGLTGALQAYVLNLQLFPKLTWMCFNKVMRIFLYRLV